MVDMGVLAAINYGEALLGAAAFIGAAGVVWRSVIKPGAKAIAEREITQPTLAAIARMSPPITDQLEEIAEELRSMTDRLDAIEKRLP